MDKGGDVTVLHACRGVNVVGEVYEDTILPPHLPHREKTSLEIAHVEGQAITRLHPL